MSADNHQGLLYNFFVRGKDLPENFESRLFKLITLPNGTTKNTSPNRLDDLNEFVHPYLSNLSSPLLKDVAVSSGISTLEWMKHLEANNVQAVITATDLFVKAFLVMKSCSVAILCDRNYNPVLVEAWNSFFRTSFPKGSFRYRWGKLISKITEALWMHKMTEEKLQHNGRMIPVELLTSGLRSSKAISFSEEDILLPPPKKEIEKYDAIRAANILNKVYFSPAEMEQILSNMASQLKQGGLLIVCKTDDEGSNHASLFTLEGNRFLLLKNMNGGSEIEDHVLQFSFNK